MTKIFTYQYATFRLRLMYAVMTAFVFMTFIYGMNVYKVISHSIAIQRTEAQIAATGSTVAKLDAHYLELSGKITPDRIKAYGLKQTPVADFISRTPTEHRVALLGHEH